MDSSISSKWNVSASQATFFEMLSAWSASFLADMTRISRGMNHRACKEGRPCVYTFASFRQGCCVMTGFLPETGRPKDSAHESVGSEHVRAWGKCWPGFQTVWRQAPK